MRSGLEAATLAMSAIGLLGRPSESEFVPRELDSDYVPGHGQPPARLSLEMTSPYFDKCYKHVEVWFNGEKRPADVQEYNQEAGYIYVRSRTRSGRFLKDVRGAYVLKRLEGVVEPRWAPQKSISEIVTNGMRPRENTDDTATISAAEAKRARKAAKLTRDAERRQQS